MRPANQFDKINPLIIDFRISKATVRQAFFFLSHSFLSHQCYTHFAAPKLRLKLVKLQSDDTLKAMYCFYPIVSRGFTLFFAFILCGLLSRAVSNFVYRSISVKIRITQSVATSEVNILNTRYELTTIEA